MTQHFYNNPIECTSTVAREDSTLNLVAFREDRTFVVETTDVYAEPISAIAFSPAKALYEHLSLPEVQQILGF